MISENNSISSNQTIFNQTQIDYLSSLHFINTIDHHLRILSSIKLISAAMNTPPRVMLQLEIYYDNHQTGSLSFDLHNYGYADIIAVAQNIRSNDFILQEVDNFLSGDVVE